jgi:hypothetical protein
MPVCYDPQTVEIPKDLRSEINEKIVHVIETKAHKDYDLTREEIFNSYTGKGGLHGLDRADFKNYHEYSQAKKSYEGGQFFTPPAVCQEIVEAVAPTHFEKIADLTFGIGHFFNYCPEQKNCYGTEIDPDAYKVAKFLYPKAHLENHNILNYETPEKMDIVFGNPPFNIALDYDYNYMTDERKPVLSQHYYLRAASDSLKNGGFLAVITPLHFLTDEFWEKTRINELNLNFNFLCQYKLPSNAFKSLGVSKFETKVMFFQKKSAYLEEKAYNPDHFVSREEVKTILTLAREKRYSVRNQIKLENLGRAKKARPFEYKVQKYLYDIKRHPRLKKYYKDALDYLYKYHHQEKPWNMDDKEWARTKITKNKVLAYLKSTLQKQHPKKQHKTLYKTKYGLKDPQNSFYKSFNDMILDNYYPFASDKYKKLFLKKKREYEIQCQSFQEMEREPEIDQFLNDFRLHNFGADLFSDLIELREEQKKDLGLALQKKYSFLSWEQGSGKTIAGITWFSYHFQKKHVNNVIIAGPAIAIRKTWYEFLDKYNFDYVKLDSKKALENLRPGQVGVITLKKIIDLAKDLKAFCRRNNQKVGLVFDESDNLTNYRAKQTKATMNAFRKLKYKLLLTGTSTRNNIVEVYPQLELLYNNSVNMTCFCQVKYRRKDGDIVPVSNNLFRQPFPAYRGSTLFQQCFNPEKKTVFGVGKNTQDIYHLDQLVELLDKTIITRRFEEIAGEKKHTIKTHKIKQHDDEKAVYRIIVKEFSRMMHYFKQSKDARKESMMKLIRQIQLLIKASSIPHLFREYTGGDRLPNKYKHIFKLLNSWKTEKVAIGTTTKDAAHDYFNHISAKYKDRPCFLITGDVTIQRRSKIIQEFEKSMNGILISTQQSLSSSVNIPTCNRVIIESCQWNIPKMSQYYFRFIRLNSLEETEVHFITYDYTIEQNLLALLMTKEQLNETIKTREYKEKSAIFADFDIDVSIFDTIMTKEYDSNGNVRLTWGEQNIA